MKGVEPPRRKAPDPKSGASANSATSRILNFFWWRMVDSNHRNRRINRFTVCPLWPLGKSSVFMELVIGIEPTTCWLQVSCSYRWATLAYLAGITGLEPVTHWLTVNCSTKLSHIPAYLIWRPGRDSNPRPPAWQAGISNQLNYQAAYISGGTNRARTCDPLLVRAGALPAEL